MEQINTGLTEQQRHGVVETLNRLLADEHVLYIKTRNYHWNVVGPRFHSLHVFLEEQYGQLAETIDEVAETARQFGGVAAGTMKEFLQQTRLRETPGQVPDEDGILRDLLNDHESVTRALREDVERADEEYKAADAADFLTSILEKHNKMAWMLRAFLPSAGGKHQSSRESNDALVGSHG
ncbi:MAG TPA: DNA starvation/stationary phase protection protein [Bryobacteraceae bacterium]|nr:DNA starvation/stationary phase protection protein [Bryobacteraceae bacterium]